MKNGKKEKRLKHYLDFCKILLVDFQSFTNHIYRKLFGITKVQLQ